MKLYGQKIYFQREGSTYGKVYDPESDQTAFTAVTATYAHWRKLDIVEDTFELPIPFIEKIKKYDLDAAKHPSAIIDGNIAHESQYFEWLPWVAGTLDQVPEDLDQRREWFVNWRGRPNITPEIRKSLEKWYGSEKAEQAVHAEAFEIAEYGRQPSEDEVRRLFPMLGQ